MSQSEDKIVVGIGAAVFRRDSPESKGTAWIFAVWVSKGVAPWVPLWEEHLLAEGP